MEHIKSTGLFIKVNPVIVGWITDVCSGPDGGICKSFARGLVMCAAGKWREMPLPRTELGELCSQSVILDVHLGKIAS